MKTGYILVGKTIHQVEKDLILQTGALMDKFISKLVCRFFGHDDALDFEKETYHCERCERKGTCK